MKRNRLDLQSALDLLRITDQHQQYAHLLRSAVSHAFKGLPARGMDDDTDAVIRTSARVGVQKFMIDRSML